MAVKKSARDMAFEVLLRIERTNSYANLLLSPALVKSGLNTRDRAFCTELVYGTIKMQGALDWVLQERSNIPLAKLDPPVHILLRLGAYQILFTRVPIAAACFETVKQAKRFSHSGGARYVNAVLRRLAREGNQIKFPDIKEKPMLHLATKYSHPQWLVKKWLQQLGLEETIEICRANNLVPTLCLRTNCTLTTRPQLALLLKEKGFTPVLSQMMPEALHIEGAGPVIKLPGFDAGLFTVQDESSMIVAHALAPKSGDRVLDACAGPGGKATHLAEFMNDKGLILAADIYPHKLTLVQKSAARLHLSCITTKEIDARRLPLNLKGRFDKVLIDAPCSGTGVLRRRPDLRWKKTAAGLASLAKLQLELLMGASEALMDGGTLLYSTCSLEPEENIEVAAAFLKLRPQFRVLDLRPRLQGLIQEPTLREGFLQLYPHKHNTDGFFLAAFERCREGVGHG
jgi:16S rRNA (cytosine967-C5)-methyltransferase